VLESAGEGLGDEVEREVRAPHARCDVRGDRLEVAGVEASERLGVGTAQQLGVLVHTLTYGAARVL
jgi:hypothetical protein